MSNTASKIQLYIAQAVTLSIGELSGVELAFSATNDESLHCRIKILDIHNDKFGDQNIRLDVSYLPELGIPFYKLRLRQPSGETGFDSVTVPHRIIGSFLEDSFLATDKPGTLWAFSNFVDAGETDLMRFFERKGDAPMMVTYHHPDARLRPYLEKTPFSRTDALESLKLLVNSVNFCGAALVWSWADGLNPVLLSGKSKIFIADLIKKLGPELVDVIEVNSENRLPEW